MSSIVISGDTSGSVTLQAPAVAGSTVLNLPSTSGTIQTSGAGYTTNGVAYASSTTGLTATAALNWNPSTQQLGFQNAAATGYAYIGTAGAGSNTDLGFYMGASEGMRLTSTGLGIGTSSPAYKLEASSSTNNYIGVTCTTDGNAASRFKNTQRDWLVGVLGGASGAFGVFDITASAQRLTLDSSGNLGLGGVPTNYSGYKTFAIIGGASGAVIDASTSGGLTAGGMQVGITPALTTIDAYGPSGGAASNFSFRVGTYGAVVEGMRLTSTGLGIGTSSPAVKLDVVGSARFSGFDSGFYNENVLARGNASFDPKIGMASTTGYRWNMRIADVSASNAGNFVIRYEEGSLDTLTINRSGNLGLGVTPSAWSGVTALQVSGSAALYATNSVAGLSFNQYFNGTNNIYLQSDFSNRFQMDSGAFKFFTAPSGTAGNAISFTQAMTLDASGNLGIGTTSPAQRLDVNGNFRFANFTSGATSGFFGCADTGSITLNFGGTTTPQKGRIFYSDNSDFFSFSTNSTERMRLDSSGNLIQSAPTTPPTLATNGQMVFNLTSNTNLRVSVRGSDGVTRTANITLA